LLKEIGEKNLSLAQPLTEFWFWLKGIGERNLNLAQPHRILVLVKRDQRKGSQFSTTTPDFLVLVKGISV